MVIDFTQYSLPAKEPESGSTRNWSLMGEINQKRVRPQDKTDTVNEIPIEEKALISKYYPALFMK